MLLLSVLFFARIFGTPSFAVENDCENYFDEQACTGAGCQWVNEEGELSCEAELDPEVEYYGTGTGTGAQTEESAELAEDQAESQAEAAEEGYGTGTGTGAQTEESAELAEDQAEYQAEAAEEGTGVERDCEIYFDEASCTGAGCQWLNEEGELSCEAELDSELEYEGAAVAGAGATGSVGLEMEDRDPLEPGEVREPVEPEDANVPYYVEPDVAPVLKKQRQTGAALVEPECELYRIDQATCESNGCNWCVDEEGEISCEFEACIEADETAEDQAEAVEDQAELNEPEEAAELAEEQAEMGVASGETAPGTQVIGEIEDVDPLEPGEVAEPLEPEDQIAGTYIEAEEPEIEYEDTIPGSGVLRKPLHEKDPENTTAVGSWFLLGCTFLISVTLSVWCVTKTVEYMDRRKINNIDLDTLTEEFNYESLA